MSRKGKTGPKTDNKLKDTVDEKAVTLTDAPTPATKEVTTNGLFQPLKTTAAQANDMDRTLYEIPQPSHVDAMTDLIKNHPQGDLFPYVGLVGSEGEMSDARRARMLALKPSYNKRDFPEVQVLGCPLISREGSFTMGNLMEYAKANTKQIPDLGGPVPSGAHMPNYAITKPYIHIKQITVLFTPNVSSSSNFCRFWINLVDNRLIDSDRGSQTNVAVSNQESILEMACDYCVSASDFAIFSLNYTMERDVVHPGFQWGTASFYFNITESDLPYQTSKVDAMGVYRMPITTLIDRKTNADKSDISFTPADIVQLRRMYARGDIVDVDEPKKARMKKSAYSKSMRQQPKGEEIDTDGKPGWEFMKGAVKQKVDAYQASVEPEEDDEPMPEEIDKEEVSRKRKEALARYQKEQEEAKAQIEEIRSGKNKEHVKWSEPDTKRDGGSDSEELATFFKKTKPTKNVEMEVSGV